MSKKIHSKETIKKISDTLKGHTVSDVTREKISKTLVEKYKDSDFFEKMKKKQFHPCGEEHWNWKGGAPSDQTHIRSCTKYKEWRKNVFKRDENTCQISGSENNLVVHHITNYRDEKNNFDVTNGITLNKDIHILFHRLYCKYNNNKKQLYKFKKYYTKDMLKTYKVNSFTQLITLVNSTNPFIYTLILDGFILYLDEAGREKIKTLFFRKIPVEILKKDWVENENVISKI